MREVKLPPAARIRGALAALREARSLLSRPGGWTGGTCARDGKGFARPSRDPSARSFCAAGALYRACERPPERRLARSYLERCAGGEPLSLANDRLGRDGVLGLFDRAGAVAEQELALAGGGAK